MSPALHIKPGQLLSGSPASSHFFGSTLWFVAGAVPHEPPATVDLLYVTDGGTLELARNVSIDWVRHYRVEAGPT